MRQIETRLRELKVEMEDEKLPSGKSQEPLKAEREQLVAVEEWMNKYSMKGKCGKQLLNLLGSNKNTLHSHERYLVVKQREEEENEARMKKYADDLGSNTSESVE